MIWMPFQRVVCITTWPTAHPPSLKYRRGHGYGRRAPKHLPFAFLFVFALHTAVPSHGGHDVIVLFLGPLRAEGGCVHPQALQLGSGSPVGRCALGVASTRSCLWAQSPRRRGHLEGEKKHRELKGMCVRASRPGKHRFQHRHGSVQSRSVAGSRNFLFFSQSQTASLL